MTYQEQWEQLTSQLEEAEAKANNAMLKIFKDNNKNFVSADKLKEMRELYHDSETKLKAWRAFTLFISQMNPIPWDKESEYVATIEVGSTVWPKIGGPKMQVKKKNGKEYLCFWFVGDKYKEKSLKKSTLLLRNLTGRV